MLSKTLVLITLLTGNAVATEHLDLEIGEGAERKLFPLLPGVKCPTGYRCRTRANIGHASSPMIGALKDNFNKPHAATMDWSELSDSLEQVVRSNDFCSRRGAMARAAGLAAGLSAAVVTQPAFAAETKNVKMGTDSGNLQFEPSKLQICKGDKVTWTNNKSGPHNVVFDEDAIPAGVSQEKISMDDQIGDEGGTWSMTFDTAGTYDYYCEPHRGAGMNAVLIVA